MATTVQQILNAAYAKSKLNMPGVIATESTELLELVTRGLRGLFAYAARVNPTYFGASAAVPFAAPGWARPVAAEAVFRIETAAGVEVVVVPFEDRLADSGLPSVYPFGQVYRPASGDAPHPQAGNLTFFYSKRPDTPTTVATVIDAMWPEQFNELLVDETAIYLAIKDGRNAEVPGLTAERDRWLGQFTAFLEHETMNMRRRFGHIPRFNTQSRVPLVSLLAGGAPS